MGNMLSVAISKHEPELILLLNEQAAFYSYFKNVDGVISRVINKLTLPPTMAPTTEAYYLANQAGAESVKEEETSSRAKFGVFVKLSVGGLWMCLTFFSV
jgi:hypothetical protein